MHPGLVEDLRAIEVEPIKDRIGHYLADNLTADLSGTGQTPPAKYQADRDGRDIGTTTPTVELAYQRRNFSDHDWRSAGYTLNKVNGGAQVLTGVASANATYDRSQQRYNDLRAARDAEIRLGAVAVAGDLSSVSPRSSPGKLHVKGAAL